MKLGAKSTFIKIPITQLRETGNVRHEYDMLGIRELAESIRQNGLMNPLTVKPGIEDENGNKIYELIAGHRRKRAMEWLCEQGDDFSMVECCIRTGNKLTLQLIENIQRTDITQREKEAAVSAMLNEGYSQSEIAKELSKPLSWISDIVAGTKVREFADKNSLNTENISTKALSQLRSIPKSKLKRALTQLVKNGGSYKAATQIMQDDKKDESTTYVSSNKDEDLIEPSKFSEKDFYDTDEKDKKESRFSPGTQIDKIGKRLFFKDLWTNRSFVRIIDGKRIVCRIISAVEEYTKKVDIYWWTDERDSKGHNIMQKMVLEDFLIDSEENNKYWWIYEIPDDAIAINLVNFEPIIRRSNDCTNKQKGFANPVSKEIQKRWVVFCRDKKIPESEKTAFKFYQELTGYFENTRKD